MFKFTVYSSKIDRGFRVVAGEHTAMSDPLNWRVSVYEGLTAPAAAMAAYANESIERIREQILRFIPEGFVFEGQPSQQSQAVIAASLARVKERRHLGGLKRSTVKAGPGRPVKVLDVSSVYPIRRVK